jgi:hypothetical protein
MAMRDDGMPPYGKEPGAAGGILVHPIESKDKNSGCVPKRLEMTVRLQCYDNGAMRWG